MLHHARLFTAAERESLYQGRILVFRQVDAMVELCRVAEALVSGYVAEAGQCGVASGRDDGEAAAAAAAAAAVSGTATEASAATETTAAVVQRAVDADADAMMELCSRYEASEEVDGLFREALRQVGVDPASTLWDRVRLRVVPSGAAEDDVSDVRQGTGRFSSTLPLHRDTWGSNLHAQCNWWAPLLPLAAGRTLNLYPAHFTVPLPNTSSAWDYGELKRRRRRGEGYPQLAMLEVDALTGDQRAAMLTDTAPLLVNPGDLVVFSGAHLHGSALNGTGVARMSTEVRTVNYADWAAGRGAVNIDGEPVGGQVPGLEWFRGMASRKRLPVFAPESASAGAGARTGVAASGVAASGGTGTAVGSRRGMGEAEVGWGWRRWTSPSVLSAIATPLSMASAPNAPTSTAPTAFAGTSLASSTTGSSPGTARSARIWPPRGNSHGANHMNEPDTLPYTSSAVVVCEPALSPSGAWF